MPEGNVGEAVPFYQDDICCDLKYSTWLRFPCAVGLQNLDVLHTLNLCCYVTEYSGLWKLVCSQEQCCPSLLILDTQAKSTKQAVNVAQSHKTSTDTPRKVEGAPRVRQPGATYPEVI